MSEVEAWDLLLDVFATRAQTSDYMPGDEVAYTRWVGTVPVLIRIVLTV
jgi:hypothetical protein